ncbi:CHAT domain-containing protein [Argonema antarcticum]|uniref:CHAT domain-containing protein n=1 Tax=Argonema antarcticum TaxID=2942763 RepID=UPI002012CEAD|nr:CHAT domain-containing protein [Argonema antarcticum]MCL1469868.1 CHAT domain-containing protein [Argonema antarcticum A004/B2]
MSKHYSLCNISQVKKWLTRIALALLAAFFSTNIATAVPKSTITANLSPIPISQSPIANPQQLLQQGKEFFQAEQFSEALTVWQQAVLAYQVSGDKLNQARAYNLLSAAYQQLGKLPEAQEAIASSLSLLRSPENRGDSTNKLSIFAQALNTQGHLQLALGKPEDALTTWQEAAAIYSQIKHPEGIIGSQINQAQAMQYLGLYRQARKSLEQLETTLQNQPDSSIKATGLHSLGSIMRAIGELEKSRLLLQQSLKIAQELRSPAAISAAQFSLGNTARALAKRAAQSDDTAAKTEIQNAVNAYQEAAKSSTSPKMQVQAQLSLLSLLVENQQFAEAEELRSQIQFNQLPPSRSAIYAQVNLAQTLMKMSVVSRQSSIVSGDEKRTTDIAQILAKAVQQAKTLKDTQAESYAVGSLGRLYELNKQYKEAQNLTQHALISAQSIDASDIAYLWQWQLGRLAKNQGNRKDAIAAYTTAVETLKSLRSDLVAINPDNPDVQFSFRESVEPVYRQLVDLLLSTEVEPSQENLLQARFIIESLQLAELDNFFQEACLDAKPVQIDQVDSTAAVIYPIILPDKLAIILALPQSPLRYYAIIKPEQEIVTVLDQLQQDIGRLTGNNQQVLRLSQQLYDWIIRAAEADIKNAKVQTLVFVLDGLLRNIPMAALHDGQQYLIEKYSIALTPGLQLLPPQPLKREQLRTLAVGLSEARQGFSALPNVTRELAEIKTQPSTNQELLNQEFTSINLQTALKSFPFPVVHIATHGQFSSLAEKTFILTWDKKINVKELDNLLRRREQDESRPIELLVFSACETAAGDNRAALGLAGVAMRAGARSTLATLWQVSDESTATLMTKFYSELGKPGVTKSEALRLAQQTLLQDSRYRLPFYWAPYVLVGNWR